MKSTHVAVINARNAQRGVAAVEFAAVAIVFLLLMFGVMEFGRLMYLWNTVQEVTRNAARQAVVVDFTKTADVNAIKRAAVFRTNDGPLPASSEITSARVIIRYLNALEVEPNPMPSSPGDNIAACIDASRVAQCIRFVEVCVSTGTTCDVNQSVPFSPMIGLFSIFANLKIPMSTVRMPAESLGFVP